MTQRVTTRTALDSYLVDLVGEDHARNLTFDTIDILVDAIIAAELRLLAAAQATPSDLLSRAEQLESIAALR